MVGADEVLAVFCHLQGFHKLASQLGILSQSLSVAPVPDQDGKVY